MFAAGELGDSEWWWYSGREAQAGQNTGIALWARRRGLCERRGGSRVHDCSVVVHPLGADDFDALFVHLTPVMSTWKWHH
jgi:hypothetical protein